MLRNKKGVVALEGLLSIWILILTMWVMWGVSIIIFNTSMLNTATQLSAQAGLITYSRTSYIGSLPSGGALKTKAEDRAFRAALSVFRENTCGLMNSQTGAEGINLCHDTSISESSPYVGNTIPLLIFGIEFSCANTRNILVNPEQASNRFAYSGTPCGSNYATALSVSVNGAITSPFQLFTQSSGSLGSTTRAPDQQRLIRGLGTSYLFLD